MKTARQPNPLERGATQGESPVGEVTAASDGCLSSAGHVQSGMNPGRPLSKAKYSLATDSVRVPRGKGEKNPGRGVKQNLKPYICKLS